MAETIEHVVRGHRRRTGEAVAFQVEEAPVQAQLATKIAAYRIIQEALTNASRHAAGSHVGVSVTGDDEHLHIEVVDDGPGFDPGPHNGAGDRLGLFGMRERVESLGGELHISAAPGKGTTLAADLPLWTGETHD